MTYELIALDMDGTLLNADKKISDGCVEAMKRANQAGKIVVIATGRSLSELHEYEKEFEDVRFVIAESGALVYDWQKKQVLKAETFMPEHVDVIAQVSQMEDIMIQMFIQGNTYCPKDKVHRLSDYKMGEYQPLFDAVSNEVEDVVTFCRQHRTEFEKINLYHRGEEERLRSLSRLENLPVDQVFAEQTSLELSPKGINKGTGLHFLCDWLRMDISKTIAVGDNYNDAEIMKCAGLAIAMQNSNPDILAMADQIVRDNNHDGCVQAIEEYLL